MSRRLSTASPENSAAGSRLSRFAAHTLVAVVLAFAWLRFSDNTVDNDLWGHVLYGQRNLAAGALERTDTLSWTAAGQPWINHEALAEITFGWVHQHVGGSGLWLLMVLLAGTTVAWAAFSGAGREPAQRWTALLLLGISVNFIALGYAVRPQLFTMLGLVALIHALRRFFSGSLAWGCVLPPLFAAWVNFHGGFLAGLVVLLLAAASETISLVVPALPRLLNFAPASWRPGWIRIVAVTTVSILALALNPWGMGLVEWTIQTVRLPRPQITEWQPLGFTIANIPFHFVLAVTVVAWVLTRRPRRIWEAAVLGALAAMAILHQRHAPLFGLANLMLTPPHLADAIDQLGSHLPTVPRLIRRPAFQWPAALVLSVAALACLDRSVAPPRQHPFALEVQKDAYPVSALTFLREHRLTGNTVTFFDWGQEVLWELPDNPVSFDGRLDTVYPGPIMDAHWDLYSGRRLDPALDLARAEVALLPTESGGVDLLRRAGWTLVYCDPLATILVKSMPHFAQLASLRLPILAGSQAITGRVNFPDVPPQLAVPGHPR